MGSTAHGRVKEEAEGWSGGKLLGDGGFTMNFALKKIGILMLVMAATAGLAVGKEWASGSILGMSQTTTTSPMMSQPKIVLHYVVMTKEWTLKVDYTYHPPKKQDEPEVPGKNAPPEMMLGGSTEVAVEGHHVYVKDVNGKEVKMEIKKKMKN